MYLHTIPNPSHLVKVSANDTTPDVLASKLAAESGVSLTVTTDGGNETLMVSLEEQTNLTLPAEGAIYFGNSATDGTWRVIRNGANKAQPSL